MSNTLGDTLLTKFKELLKDMLDHVYVVVNLLKFFFNNYGSKETN